MQLKQRIRHLFQPKAMVLMYHRIAVLKTDPWGLAVSPENFEQQLRVLQKNVNVITVKELVSSLYNKKIPDNAVCVTFDDGYVDNFIEAKPLLEKYQCPATFFIPTHYIGQQHQYWWDELESIMLSYPALPTTLSLSINNSLFEFDLGNDSILTDAQLTAHEKWAWPATPPTKRCELYLSIWEKIRALPFNELQLILQEIKSWASFNIPSTTENFPMGHSQLSELADHSLIDIGLHTDTHPALAYHSKEVQCSEVSVNKKELENICGGPLETMAYPYGNYNELTLSVVKEINLNAGFTTAEKIVSNLTAPFQIGRFQVRNWNGNDFEKHLVMWKKSPQFL